MKYVKPHKIDAEVLQERLDKYSKQDKSRHRSKDSRGENKKDHIDYLSLSDDRGKDADDTYAKDRGVYNSYEMSDQMRLHRLDIERSQNRSQTREEHEREVAERKQHMQLQMENMNSIEIQGIPDHIDDGNLASEVVKIFAAMDIVENDMPTVQDIKECTRAGAVTRCTFADSKHAQLGVEGARSLKGSSIYGVDSRIFIRVLLCPYYKTLSYAIRTARREGLICNSRVFEGITISE